MIQQSSLAAFEEIQKSGSLGVKQFQVYNFFKTHEGKDFTNTELSYVLGLPINCITPRVYELRGKNLIEKSQVRYCKITGKLVIAWKLR